MPESYYLFSNGVLKRKDNVVRLTAPDGKFKDLKIEMTRDIFLFGEVDVNTKCLNYLGQLSIPVHFFNYYGFYTGSFCPRETNVSGHLLVNQVDHYTDQDKRTVLAREFVNGGCYNMMRNLRYYRQRGKEVEKQIVEMKKLQKEIDRAKSVQELLGIEGNVRKQYYSAWNTIVNQKIDFTKRVKHPPDNMINTLISYLNSLVYSSCLSEIYVTQLDPTVSYLHSAGTRRFSLCLDISEIFKPLIADRIIFSLLNKREITEKDFKKESNYYYLKESGQKRILQAFDERMKETITHRDLKRKVSYRRLIR
ncbi:type I-B CRISPR-associated endonuclease Cas1b [Terrilactibacillus laevilacticus]|uniref:type I-B CRISPR-associated endonuclease Cas1b n=1 Tax=Terrilactibacillus laevilacticus TaxID=1380157 RepID=UPI001FE93A3F|nr:type I-B CRISPR-associated endonuclease Cas1b [Terrilactibacillus laevilacticus]